MKTESCQTQVPKLRPSPIQHEPQPTPRTAPQPLPGNKAATSLFASAVELHTNQTTSPPREARCAVEFPAASTSPSTPNPSDSETGASRAGGRMRLRFQ